MINYIDVLDWYKSNTSAGLIQVICINQAVVDWKSIWVDHLLLTNHLKSLNTIASDWRTSVWYPSKNKWLLFWRWTEQSWITLSTKWFALTQITPVVKMSASATTDIEILRRLLLVVVTAYFLSWLIALEMDKKGAPDTMSSHNADPGRLRL